MALLPERDEGHAERAIKKLPGGSFFKWRSVCAAISGP
jgi:hypothetical protein